MTQTRWWWVRHAPVPDGGRIYGQSDLDCDCTDAAVFTTLAAELPRNAVWVTSNLKRTHQTAAAILRAADGAHGPVAPAIIPDLAEQHLGDWQGLERKPFYEARKVGTHTLWFAPADETPPGGESFATLVARTAAVIHRLNREHRGRDIVSVGHGGNIRAAVALALGLSPQAALGLFVENCSITRLDYITPPDGEPLWRVVAVNHRPWPRPVQPGGAAI